MNPRLLLIALVGGCDLWISETEFTNFERDLCAATFAALDEDGDGFLAQDAALPARCPVSLDELIAAAQLQEGDCDDRDPEVWPGAADLCDDGVDQDCDGADAALAIWYEDQDGDGYGDVLTGQELCDPPAGASANGEDCDDEDPAVHPGAVETTCGDSGRLTDMNCDGRTVCALRGDLDEEDWADLGVSLTLGSGAGRALAADASAGGQILVGGDNAAWTLRYAHGALNAEEIVLEGSEDAGADLCWLPDVDGDGALDVMVADPTYGEDLGRVSVRYANGEIGSLTGADDDERVGAALACEGGLATVMRRLESFWRVYFLYPEDLPGGGEIVRLSSVDIPDLIVAELDDAPSTSVALDVLPTSTDWLIAVGRPEPDSEGDHVIVYSLKDDHLGRLCQIESPTSTTLGSAVLLTDLDGDGQPDLIVGDPGERIAYVFSDVRSCDVWSTGVNDADYTIQGSVARLGEGLAAVPDMNGDGLDDLLVSGTNGAVLVFGFEPNARTTDALTPTATIKGRDGFAASVTSDDLNQDGFADLVFGAPEVGRVVALWGGP